MLRVEVVRRVLLWVMLVLGVLLSVGCEGLFEPAEDTEGAPRTVGYSVSGAFGDGVTVRYMDGDGVMVNAGLVTDSWAKEVKMGSGSAVALSVVSEDGAVNVTLRVSVDGSEQKQRSLNSAGEQRITFLLE